jgi:hypothetical protein
MHPCHRFHRPQNYQHADYVPTKIFILHQENANNNEVTDQCSNTMPIENMKIIQEAKTNVSKGRGDS